MRLPTPTATATPLPDASRVITYTYDGLDRLVGAIESPGTTSAYGYDLAGNRTSVAVHGAAPVITTSNLANKITSGGVSYDLAGNLANDGTATYTYDALNRTTARGTTTYTYTGDGTLVSQATGGVTTRYTQDLVAPLSQVLQSFTGATRTEYLYGANPPGHAHQRRAHLVCVRRAWQRTPHRFRYGNTARYRDLRPVGHGGERQRADLRLHRRTAAGRRCVPAGAVVPGGAGTVCERRSVRGRGGDAV